jgi:hypothetical protein
MSRSAGPDPILETLELCDVPAELHAELYPVVREAFAVWLERRGLTIVGGVVRTELQLEITGTVTV